MEENANVGRGNVPGDMIIRVVHGFALPQLYVIQEECGEQKDT